MHTEKMTTGEAPCNDTRVLDKPQTRATSSAATRYPVMKPVKDDRQRVQDHEGLERRLDNATGKIARALTLQSQSVDCRTR